MQGAELLPSAVGAGLTVALNGVIILIASNIRQSVRALRSEMDAKFAESALQFYQRVNGTYVRADLHNDLKDRVARLEGNLDAGR